MKKKILLVTLLLSISFYGQINNEKIKHDNDLKISSLPYFSYGKGIGITSPDSLYQFNIRFRIQNRLSYYDTEGVDPYYEAQVRRLRLRFDGFVGSPKFLYVMQLSFGAGDVGVEKTGENLNVIRDVMVYYRPNKQWQLGFGVTKLPGTRQTVNSSGAIEFTDRSINNFKFGIDRDFGFHFVNLHEKPNQFSYDFKGAITLGEGRNWTTNNPNTPIKDNNGLCFTGKIELLPLGTFKRDGQYFEGDILRESKPKFMISGAYSYNQKARKTLGQTGDLLYSAHDMKSLLVDAIAKYNGWAFMATYMNRMSTNPITVNPTDATQTKVIFNGYGTDFQLSYVFKSNYEFMTRYSIQKMDNEVFKYYPNTNEFSFGINKYIWEHAFKLQAEASFDKLDNYDGTTKNNWYIRFQIEMGI